MSSSSSDPVACCETMPGYRFAPTDEDLIQHYMTRITSGYPIVQGTIIPFDVYSADPSTLPCEFVNGNHRNEAYFFTPRHRPTGYRGLGNQVSRTVGSTGAWHISGETDVRDRRGNVIGRKATFTFKKRTTGNRFVGTDWKMQELLTLAGDGEFQEWAVCRIYKKKRAARVEEDEGAAITSYSYGGPSKKRARITRDVGCASSAIKQEPVYLECPGEILYEGEQELQEQALHSNMYFDHPADLGARMASEHEGGGATAEAAQISDPYPSFSPLADATLAGTGVTELDPDYFTGFNVSVQPARNCCSIWDVRGYDDDGCSSPYMFGSLPTPTLASAQIY